MNPNTMRYAPQGHYYRDLPTKTLLDEYECWSWSLSELDETWDYAEQTKAYIQFRLNQIADEINVRQRVREQPGAPKWPQEVVDRRQDLAAIKAHFELSEFIESYTPVRFTKAGDELVCCCPFLDHDDGSPSFYVNPQKQVFKCFGCGRGGDLFEFARHWLGIAEFKDVADILGQWAGITSLHKIEAPFRGASQSVVKPFVKPFPDGPMELRGGKVVPR